MQNTRISRQRRASRHVIVVATSFTFALAFAAFISPAHAALVSAWEFNAGDLSGLNVAATGGTIFGDARYTGALQADAYLAGGVLLLDGAGDYLQFGSNLTEVRSLGAMTVAAWVKPADASTAMRRIVEHEDNFYFWQQGGNYRYTTHGTAGDGQAISTTAPSSGAWQHVLATYVGGNLAQIYVDGTPVEDTSGVNQVAMPNNAHTLQVGARRGGSGTASNFFHGELDDVAIWNTVLGESDINALAGQGSGGYSGRTTPTAVSTLTTTLAQWNFEELTPPETTSDGQRLVDSSGNSRDAFAGGGATTPIVVAGSGLYGSSAVRFDFDSDAVIFRDGFSGFVGGGSAAGSDINFGQNDSFTVEAVIRAAVDPGSDGAGAIVAKDTAGGVPSWWFRMLDDGTLQAIVEDGDGTAGTLGLVAGTTAINDNLWHHVAFVRDADNDEVRLYIDHVLEATAIDATTGTSFNNVDIRLGAFNNSTRQFQGDMDLARISSGALSPSQFVQPVPEPGSALLLCVGLAMIGMLLRRCRR